RPSTAPSLLRAPRPARPPKAPGSPRAPRPPRPGRGGTRGMSVIHNIGKTEKAEMYLKAILLIGYENPPVTVTKIAEFLGVSPASVSEMMKRMEANDLVINTGTGIALTETGLQDARKLVRRMRLAERLLSDILGLPLDQVYEEACRLEH